MTDADTVNLRVAMGFHITLQVVCRLSGFDAPETWRPKTNAERAAGEHATAHLRYLLEDVNEDPKKQLFIHSKKYGIYNRIEGELFIIKNNELCSVNEEMIKFLAEHDYTKERLRAIID
jgi:endonuclease YncB( thermonuclease family)